MVYNYGYPMDPIHYSYQQPMPQSGTSYVPQQPQQMAPQYQYYSYIVVNSEDEADKVPLELNAQILILNLNNGKAYVRKRDSLGQYTMEKFLVVKEDAPQAVSYVTKEEFESFKNMIIKNGVKENE